MGNPRHHEGIGLPFPEGNGALPVSKRRAAGVPESVSGTLRIVSSPSVPWLCSSKTMLSGKVSVLIMQANVTVEDAASWIGI